MTPERRKALERAGFRVGDAADFVGMSPDEREMLRLRLAIARLTGQLRKQHNLTPKAAAVRMKLELGGVAKIEAGDASVPLDKAFSGIFRLGGTFKALVPAPVRRRKLPTVKLPAQQKVVS